MYRAYARTAPLPRGKDAAFSHYIVEMDAEGNFVLCANGRCGVPAPRKPDPFTEFATREEANMAISKAVQFFDRTETRSWKVVGVTP